MGDTTFNLDDLIKKYFFNIFELMRKMKSLKKTNFLILQSRGYVQFFYFYYFSLLIGSFNFSARRLY